MSEEYVVTVCGTRPELIKSAPLIRELNRLGLPNHLVLTGQHQELIAGLCDFFEITNYSILDCTRRGSSINNLLSLLVEALESEFNRLRPTVVCVQGDTTSALAGALAAFHLKIPIAHIEAGLRTGNLSSPFPEEANRRLISQLASLHFAPTEKALYNLTSEGFNTSDIFVVGNTIVDATSFALRKIEKGPGKRRSRPYFVVTIHRRESWENTISSILAAIRFLAEENDSPEIKFVMHANPDLQLMVRNHLAETPNVELLKPLNYPDFLALVSQAKMILSDSGGIQEEAPTLGVPTVVLRDNTERPEAIEIDACRLGGTQTETIIKVVKNWQRDLERGEWNPPTENPFGDGLTAKEIVRVLRRRNPRKNPDVPG